MRGYRKKVLSLFTAFMMLLSMGISEPFIVRAEGAVISPTIWNDLTLNGDILDLSNFNDTDAGGKTITVAGGAATIKGDANKTFKNLSIIITNGSIVTIENLNITNDVFNSSPIIANDGSDNTLITSGVNNIRLSISNSNNPGISVEGSAKLLIMSTDTNAKLNVYGGQNGAGIGGGSTGSVGIITIGGDAEVTATGGEHGAGIGGGSIGSGGIITIGGDAEVTATGGNDGAGIGGGSHGSGGTIIIDENAKVTATGGGGFCGAGIGGGSNGSGGEIKIEGNAEVTAIGGEGFSAAGIGGGAGGSGGIITIDGNAEVTANGGEGGSFFGAATGIGGGSSGSGGTIKIDGNAKVTAIGGEGASVAGIGYGTNGSGGTSTIAIGKYANITAIRKSSSSSAIDATISSLQPIISGKLSSTSLSNTAGIKIQIINTSNNLSTKSFTLPAGAYSFSTTVGGPGKYIIDAGDKSLVNSGPPIDGIYDLSSPDVHEYTNMTTSYKVTFDSQGGDIAFQYGFVASGNNVNEPAMEPTKDGRVFQGWYKEPSCISKWDFINDVVNTNTTLYAKYPSAASGIMVSTTTKIPAEAGKVMLTVIAAPSDVNHKIYYRVVDTKPTEMYVGDLITVGEWTEKKDTSPFQINAVDGKYVEAVEINVADSKVTKWGSSSTINDGYTPSYEMGLSETGILTLTFPDQAEGYSQVTPKSITVKKTGNEDITNLTAALSGVDKDSFTLVNLSSTTLNNATTEATLTVQPKNGLSAGNYTAIVNISADKIESQSTNVSFKVSPRESKPEIPPPPTIPETPTTPAAVTITGIESVEKTLEAVLLTDSRAKFTTPAGVTYEWYRLSDKDSNSGELVGYDKTYKLVEIDKGRYIKVIADYNGETFEAVTGRIDSSSSSSSSSSSHKKTSHRNTSSSAEESEATSIPVKIADGWQKQSDNTWKYGENEKAVVGWKQINDLWYFFDFNGIMQTGWELVNGSWYLFNDNGAMMTGWALVNGKWYYLTLSGAMATGWISLYEKWYYLNPSGAMETCWININGKWYYLYGDGSLAVSTILSYRVDENGVWVE